MTHPTPLPHPNSRPDDPLLEPGLVTVAMQAALAVAVEASGWGDVPIGAAVYGPEGVISAAGNEREKRSDATAHAEMLALKGASAAVEGWRLDGLGMAVTLEPCPMCAGALVAAHMRVVVYGAADPKAGAAGSLYNVCQDSRLNHEMDVVAGFMAEPAARLLSEFFAARRA